MKSIEKTIQQNLDFYKNYPEISKYFTKNRECVICQHNVSKEMQLSENSKKAIPKNVISKVASKKELSRLDCDFLIWIQNLEIREYVQPQDKILRSNNDKKVDTVAVYCKFLSCVDINSYEPFIKKFDLNYFSMAFNLCKKDKIILDFIEKLQNDPFVYEKQEKIKCLNIEIFAFSYLYKNKLDTKILRKRIEEHSFLFKPDPNYTVDLSNDILVDKMIIQLRKNTLDLNQAIFMNQVYLSTSKDKEYNDSFNRMLVDTIKNIDQNLLFSFLRHTFTFRTVLFTCINEDQLIKLILSFYKNMNKADNTISLLTALFNNLNNERISNMILNELKNACIKSKKHIKTLKLLEIRSISNIEQFKDFINENRESFDSLNLIFSQIKLISTVVEKQEHKLQIAGSCLEIFLTVKSEFFSRFISQIVNIIMEMIENCEINDNFVNFNLMYWNALSDLVLTCQKENLETKKKKSNESNQSEKYKSGLKLAKILYACEDKMTKGGILEFTRLKKRGFKIE